ncbi:hypothetical protein A4X13_0g9018, partial [Tilletia indica]
MTSYPEPLKITGVNGRQQYRCSASSCAATYRTRDHCLRHWHSRHSGELRRVKCPFEECKDKDYAETYIRAHIWDQHCTGPEATFLCGSASSTAATRPSGCSQTSAAVPPPQPRQSWSIEQIKRHQLVQDLIRAAFLESQGAVRRTKTDGICSQTSANGKARTPLSQERQELMENARSLPDPPSEAAAQRFGYWLCAIFKQRASEHFYADDKFGVQCKPAVTNEMAYARNIHREMHFSSPALPLFFVLADHLFRHNHKLYALMQQAASNKADRIE